MKRFSTLLFTLIVATTWAMAQTQTPPKMVYSKLSGTQLTIYYDNDYAYWDGDEFLWYDDVMPSQASSDPEYYKDAGMSVSSAIFYAYCQKHYDDIVETIVFDGSLADLVYPVKNAGSMFSPYYGHSKLKKIVGMDILDWSQVTEIGGMFLCCESLESVDLGFINTENVTDMSGIFRLCSSLKSVDLSSWNTENVTEMSCLFEGCTSLESVNLSSFNTANVNNMQFMFKDCTSLKTLDLSNFVYKGYYGCGGMFENCISLETLYMGLFRISSYDCIGLFNGLSSLKTLDISQFDTSVCESFGRLFSGCSSLKELDLSNFVVNTSMCDASEMFMDCSSLVTVKVGPGWNINCISPSMFSGCVNIVGQDGSTYDANCRNDQSKAHYGPGGYLKYNGAQLPIEVSPIGSEKSVTFPTDGSLANTTVDDVYYNFSGNNGYNAEEGCIVINESSTMTTGSDGKERFSEFIGLKVMVSGSGVIEIDCQTLGSRHLCVMLGEGTEPLTYTEDPRGIVQIEYDVAQPTNVYIYAGNQTRAPRMVKANEDCVKLWSLKVKPGASGISSITNIEKPQAEYYTLDGRKLNGRPVETGVYVTGGRKILVK